MAKQTKIEGTALTAESPISQTKLTWELSKLESNVKIIPTSEIFTNGFQMKGVDRWFVDGENLLSPIATSNRQAMIDNDLFQPVIDYLQNRNVKYDLNVETQRDGLSISARFSLSTKNKQIKETGDILNPEIVIWCDYLQGTAYIAFSYNRVWCANGCFRHEERKIDFSLTNETLDAQFEIVESSLEKKIADFEVLFDAKIKASELENITFTNFPVRITNEAHRFTHLQCEDFGEELNLWFVYNGHNQALWSVSETDLKAKRKIEANLQKEILNYIK